MATEGKEKKEEEKKTNSSETNETITGMAPEKEGILVYLIPLLGLIFSVMKDKKVCELAKFNYNQAGTIFLINVCLSLILGVASNFVSFLGLLSYPISIVLLVFSIMALVKTYNGEKYEIPLVSDLSKSIWGSKED